MSDDVDRSVGRRRREVIARAVEAALEEIDHNERAARLHKRSSPPRQPAHDQRQLPVPMRPVAPPVVSSGYAPMASMAAFPSFNPASTINIPANEWVGQAMQHLLHPALQMNAKEQLQHAVIKERYNGRFLAGLRSGIERFLVTYRNDGAVRGIHADLTGVVREITAIQSRLLVDSMQAAAEEQVASLRAAFVRERNWQDGQMSTELAQIPFREASAHVLRMAEPTTTSDERRALDRTLAELRAEERRDPSAQLADQVRSVARARKLVDEFSEGDETQRRFLERQLRHALDQVYRGHEAKE